MKKPDRVRTERNRAFYIDKYNVTQEYPSFEFNPCVTNLNYLFEKLQNFNLKTLHND